MFVAGSDPTPLGDAVLMVESRQVTAFRRPDSGNADLSPATCKLREVSPVL